MNKMPAVTQKWLALQYENNFVDIVHSLSLAFKS